MASKICIQPPVTTRRKMACALSVAGSDSGGGAGIQADLKTFAALGVHGVSAITCLTAQNPRSVLAIQACRPDIIRSQLEAIFAELPPAAAKTGMLYSTGIIRAVCSVFRKSRVPLIVDPVMVATSGARLLRSAAERALCSELFPLAALITPNLQETEVLSGLRLRSAEDLRMAARALHARFGCAALVKGGHLRGTRQAVDIFYDGATELLLSAPFARGVRTHGTGCTYSAAITGYVAQGLALPESVRRAKEYVTQAIHGSRAVGRHTVLNFFFP